LLFYLYFLNAYFTTPFTVKRRLREYEQPSAAPPAAEKKRLSSTLAKMLTGGSSSSSSAASSSNSNTNTPNNEKVKAKAPSRMQFVKDLASTVLQVPGVAQRTKKIPSNRRFLYHNDAVWVVEVRLYGHFSKMVVQVVFFVANTNFMLLNTIV